MVEKVDKGADTSYPPVPECRPGPDFIVIGAAKSATTSLYKYLAQHERIFMTPMKEPRFFSVDNEGRYPDLGLEAPADLVANYERNTIASWEKYCELFCDAKSLQKKGEISPQYIFTERSPEKIFKYVPDVKLVAILRHPVEIAYSAFMMNRRNGYEPEARFDLAVPLNGSRSENTWRWKLYIEQGLHGRNLKRFYSTFAEEQIIVILFEEFLASPESALGKICRHLGLEYDNRIRFGEKHNVGYEARFRPQARSMIKHLVPAFVRNKYRSQINRLDRRKVVISPDLYRNYLPVYKQDILRLEKLLGRDLSTWLE